MSEHLPDERPDWQRREEAIARAHEAVGDSYQFGAIRVNYDGDFAAGGCVWIKADCDTCGSSMVSQASHPLHVRALALDLARYQCPKFGHEQDLDVIQRQADYALGGPWGEEGDDV